MYQKSVMHNYCTCNTIIWIETHQPWARFVIHQSLTTTVVQIVRLSKSTLSPVEDLQGAVETSRLISKWQSLKKQWKLNTIKSYLMWLTTRSYGLECFWHSLVACWPSVALLHDHVCVCSVYHCSWAREADSCPAVCRLGACGGHVPTLCLRCTRSFVSVAWRGVPVA